MASLIVEIPATGLPVSLTEAKTFLRVVDSSEDSLITVLINAAVDACEAFTGRSFCTKGYKQTLDAFPYYVDSAVSQQAYPPSYYSYAPYSTTQWNYSQMIKLYAPPLRSVDRITYLSAADSQWHDLTPIPPLWYPGTVTAVGYKCMDNNGNIQVCTVAGTTQSDPPTWNKNLNGTTSETTDSPSEANGPTWRNSGPPFITGGTNAQISILQAQQFGTYIIDNNNEPARIFPGPPGNQWPVVLYVPNSVQIHFTAGYATDGTTTGDGPNRMPGAIKTAILQCVANWFENREAAMLGNFGEVPNHVKMLLWSKRVMDMQPTRG